jgi:hypothetical protein
MFVHVWLALTFISFHVITPALVVVIVIELPVGTTTQSAVIVTVPVATVPISLPVAATSAFALATTSPTDTVTELPVTAKFAAPLSVTSPIALLRRYHLQLQPLQLLLLQSL